MKSHLLKYISCLTCLHFLCLSLSGFGQDSIKLLGSWKLIKWNAPASLSEYEKGKRQFISFYPKGENQIFNDYSPSDSIGYQDGRWRSISHELVFYKQTYIYPNSPPSERPFLDTVHIRQLSDSILILYGDTTQDGMYVGEYIFKRVQTFSNKKATSIDISKVAKIYITTATDGLDTIKCVLKLLTDQQIKSFVSKWNETKSYQACNLPSTFQIYVYFKNDPPRIFRIHGRYIREQMRYIPEKEMGCYDFFDEAFFNKLYLEAKLKGDFPDKK